MIRDRPNFLVPQDVTGTVNLFDAHSVADAVCAISQHRYPDFNVQQMRQGFADLDQACLGRYPGLLPCNTPYHNLTHFLDAALLMARLVDSYEMRDNANATDLVSGEQFSVAVLLALFHDVGLLRRVHEIHRPAAEPPGELERRSVDFMRNYLEHSALASYAGQAELILVTDLTRPVSESLHGLPAKLVAIGHMLGTADLLSQMSGRYYLENCRDALYAELVTTTDQRKVSAQPVTPALYDSPQDLLRKTPVFYENVVKKRLDRDYEQVYLHLPKHFGGDDPYMRGLQRNLAYLEQLIERNDFSGLRRKPPLMPGCR